MVEDPFILASPLSPQHFAGRVRDDLNHLLQERCYPAQEIVGKSADVLVPFRLRDQLSEALGVNVRWMYTSVFTIGTGGLIGPVVLYRDK